MKVPKFYLRGMKKRNRKGRAKVLSWLLVICMVAGTLGGFTIPAAAAASETILEAEDETLCQEYPMDMTVTILVLMPNWRM